MGPSMPANKQNRSWSSTFSEQFKAADVGSLSQSANIVEQITGVNPTQKSSFTELVKECSTSGIPNLGFLIELL